MNLAPALRTAYRTLLARPVAVLPFFVVGLAAPVAGQAVLLVGSALVYLSLARTSRLGDLLAALENAVDGDGERLNVDDPAAFESLGPEVDAAAQNLLTPTVGVLLAATVLAILVTVLVANAAASAGQLHAAYAAITGRPETRNGVDGVFQHWLTFLALVVLELLVVVPVVGVAGLVVVAAAVSSPAAGALLGLVAVPFVLLVLAPARLLFAFARPAAVVDGRGVVGALRGAAGQLHRRPLESIGYGVVALVLLVGVGAVAVGLSPAQTNSVGSLASALVVAPLLALFKTALYAAAGDEPLQTPELPEAGVASRLRRTLRAGLADLGAFVRGHPVHVVASTAVLALGVVLGLRMGAQVDHVLVASIQDRLAAQHPVGTFFDYAANNWSVAAAMSFGGLGFGIPTLAGLLFNGANVGLLYALEAEPRVLLAFVAPHGVLEIPALLFGGALGLHLGVVAVRYAVGRTDRLAISREIDRAFRVTIGLAVLLVAAALIEAGVSPYYWRFLGI